ncbi:NAD(P)-binding protein [Aspergillus californicus]
MADSTVVFISGVSSGIGRGLVEAYLTRPNYTVIGSVRNGNSPAATELKSTPTAPGSKLLLVELENTSVTDPARVLAEIQAAGIEHLDIVIANAGASPPVVPLDTVETADLLTAFHTNAAAPLLLFQTFRELLKASKQPKWASISSGAGSVADIGPKGSWFLPAYGVSKAALNWITEAICFSQDWLVALTLHPGFVQSGPGNWVANQFGMEKAPTTIEESAAGIIKVIDEATRETASGKFIDAVPGSVIPW